VTQYIKQFHTQFLTSAILTLLPIHLWDIMCKIMTWFPQIRPLFF